MLNLFSHFKNKTFFYSIIFLQLISLSQAKSFDINGNFEYLAGYYIEKKDTVINPRNIFIISNYTSLAELKLTSFTKGKKFFYTDVRVRYDFVTQKESFYLDQGYFAYETNDLVKLRVGRQRIGFGVGYLWNPVNDLDISRDVYEPTKYNEGVDSIKCSFDFMSYFLQPTNFNVVIVIPKNTDEKFDLTYSKIGIQTYIFRGMTEAGFVVSYNKNNDFEDNFLVGLYSTIDFYGTIFGLECSYSKKFQSSYIGKQKIFFKEGFKPQLLINFNRRITEKSFLLVEYYYNDFGYDEKEFLQITDLLEKQYFDYVYDISKLLQLGYFSKNYVFTTFSREISDDISLNINLLSEGIFNGGFVYPQIVWTKITNLTLSVEYITNFVTNGTKNEFLLLPYNQYFLIRIKYYF